MSPEPRYVFDNSAVVSALLFEHSVPGQAFRAALHHGEILVSAATFAELSEVLERRKFDRYLTHKEREQFLAMFLREATLVEITEQVRVCRDSKGDKFLELAVNGGAACLVTGDQDLLVLHPFRGIPILMLIQFMNSLANDKERFSD